MKAIREEIARLIASGAQQLSRKYRTIGVPSVLLENGKTYLDVLRERDPIQWECLNDRARDLLMTADRSTHVELSREEFDEWLVQTGRRPFAHEQRRKP